MADKIEPMSLEEARKLVRHWEQPPVFRDAAMYRAALALDGLPERLAKRIAEDTDARAGLIEAIHSINANQGDPARLAEYIRSLLSNQDTTTKVEGS